MKNLIKQNKAITLIALVITILVLLILAGVTIATLTGDSGLLTKASEAKKTNEKATTIEKIQVEVNGSYGLDGKINEEQLTNNLKRISGLKYNNATLSDENPIELPAIVEVDNESYQITNHGDVFFIIPQAIGNLTKDNYGDYIDLGQSVEGIGTSSSADDWRILYNDKSGHVYAILSDYLPNNNVAVTASGLNKISGKTYNVNSWTSRQDLLDRLNSITAWQSLIPEGLRSTCQVKGAITAQILIASYNEKYGTSLNYKNYPYLRTNPNNSSSSIDTLYMPHPGSSHYDGCYGYWLATTYDNNTNGVWYVYYDGRMGGHDFSYNFTYYGVCPVVSLPSNLQVTSTTSNGKTIWTLVQ